MKTKIYLVIIIALVSFTFRFYKLSQHPVHLSMDEAAIVYNAYSILLTGKDEWNQKLPLAFKSAGDYKAPVNIYLTVPIVKIFGLNEFSARFVSAFLGSLTPIILLFLLLELKFSLIPSFLTSLWLAVLPWHIHFSRASFEAITALFFVFTGLMFFYKWINHKNTYNLPLFISSFCLAVWSYHAERLYIPLLAICLIILSAKRIKYSLKNTSKIIIISTIIIFLIFSVPFIRLTLFSPAITSRAAATSILKEPTLAYSLNQKCLGAKECLLDNNFIKIFKYWLNKYLEYFDPRFIFWKGMQFTPPNYPDTGILFVIDILIVIIGAYKLFITNNTKLKQLFLSLFLLGPLAASITMNHQHPLRALTWIPAFCLLIVSGFSLILKSFKIKKYTYIIILTYFINILYFINIYAYLFPYYQSEYWQYGYKEVGEYICEHRHEYNQIMVTDTFGSEGPLNTGLPYLYTLIACNMPPQEFQDSRKTYNIKYHRVDWKYDQYKKNMLIIASPWDILNDNIPSRNIIKEIYFKNNKKSFIFIKTDE
jgi:hypothetical protein